MNYGQLEKNLFGTKEKYLKAVEQDQEKHKEIERIYSSIGFRIVEALEGDSNLFEIQFDRIIMKPSAIQKIKELLQDLKDIKN